MHKLLLPCSMLLSFAAMAQDSPAGTPSENSSRWQIGVNISPQINYRLLRSTPGDQVSKQILESRNEIDIPRIQYTTGVQLGYLLNKRVTLNTGIQYSNWGGHTKRRDLIYMPPNPVLPQSVATAANLHYLSVPLTANVTFGQKRLKFTAEAGLSAMYLFRERNVFDQFYADGHTETKRDSRPYYRKFNVAPQLSAGVDYALNEHMHLKLTPVFKFAAIKSYDSPVKENLYNFGLNIAAYWKL